MKNKEELNLPEEYRYSKEHEWAVEAGDLVKVGITDYAQDQLGDLVFVELPEVGVSFETDEVFGTLESVKSVSELYIPVGGEIAETNEALDDKPELLNSDPSINWIIKVKPSDANDLKSLMSKEEYLIHLSG